MPKVFANGSDPKNDRDVLGALVRIVGQRHVLTDADASARWDGYPPVNPLCCLCIVRPADTQEVSAIVSFADRSGLKVVPHGGRTGLVGGAKADARDIVLSLERMTAISAVDGDGLFVEAEAGVPLETLQRAADDAGFFYPVDLGARGSATIGGTLATNAGGNSVFRYGMTREQVLGLEVVLADGTIMSSMNRLVKNNSGYDLKNLFIGAEGTLGVITRAVLKLLPRPADAACALVGLTNFDDVLALLRHAQASSDGALTSFEVMWSSFVECVSAGGVAFPMDAAYPFYVLIELRCREASQRIQELVAEAWDCGLIEDAVIAQNLAQEKALWAFRDSIDKIEEAIKPSIYYDISLPQTEMSDYVGQLEARLFELASDARLIVFGHIADGNLHICVNGGAFKNHHEIDDAVYGPLAEIGGSISAEHGVGLEKRDFLPICRTPAEIALMQRIKATLDPRNTLNPGKIFAS